MHARFLCTIALTAAFAAWLGAPGAIAHLPNASATQAQPAVLEPEVVAAHARALEHFPAFLRARLADIPIERREQYDIPEDAPLAWRLIGAAAHAVYSNSTQTITIFDAGVRGESRWTTDLTAPEHREAVAAFLDALAEPLGEPAGDTPALWRSFVARIRAWSRAAEPGAEPQFAEDPPLGCPRVFDAFVRLGVPRALGGTPPLEHLIVHELAHAMQLRDGGGFAMAHMRAWGSLAGWQRISTHEPFDGYAQGGFRMENPETLIALLLTDDAANAPRVNALYRHHPDAHFINPYARFDPREDFAECVRLFVADPDRLIEASPERFVFLNAMGWCAELDAASPGPLWHDREAIEARGWTDAVHGAAARLLDPAEDEPAADPLTRAAIVRAHASVLDPTKLPPPHPAPVVPKDLPNELFASIDRAHYTPTIAGIDYPPDEQRFMPMVLEQLFIWPDAEAFGRGFLGLYLAGDEESETVEAIQGLERTEQFSDRVEYFLMLLESAEVWASAPEQLRAATHRTIVHCTEANRPLLAEQLRLSLAMHDPALPEPARRAAFDHAMQRVRHAEITGDAVNLHALLAQAAWQLDPVRNPIELAERIPGQTLGLIRRVEFLLSRIEERRAADPADQTQDLIGAARAQIDASPYPALHDRLGDMLRDVLPSPEEDQP